MIGPKKEDTEAKVAIAKGIEAEIRKIARDQKTEMTRRNIKANIKRAAKGDKGLLQTQDHDCS